MLHKIEQACADYFDWVRQLQNALLSSVCAEGVTKTQVTKDWIVSQCSTYQKDWLSGFCDRKDKINNSKKSLVTHLQSIANATTTKKQKILDIFGNNQKIEQGFIDSDTEVYKLRKISAEFKDDKSIVQAYRGFFSIFYDPVFYPVNGYIVSDEILFTRPYFLEQFLTDNEIGVCVLCDGDLGDPDVDHFYSKKEFPALSMHIGNLVPICKTCNSRARKGEKAPLDFEEADQFINWYHPYFRVIDNYYIQFERRGEVRLASEDETEQIRLQNLDELIGIEERWKKRLGHIIRTTIKQLRKADFENLEDKLLEMADSKECEIGELPFGILHTGYLKLAGEGNESLVEELWEEVG